MQYTLSEKWLQLCGDWGGFHGGTRRDLMFILTTNDLSLDDWYIYWGKVRIFMANPVLE